MTPNEPRYCLRCRYDLTYTTSHACPECGRPFDPADARTFTITTSRASRRWVQLGVLFAMYPAGLAAWILLEFAICWAYTGQRPTYGSGHSFPPWWESMSEPVVTIYPWGLPVVLVGSFTLMVFGLFYSEPPHYKVRWALVAPPIIGWSALVSAVWGDPFGAFLWWVG